MIDSLPMADRRATQAPFTVWVSRELAVAFREKAKAELGNELTHNGKETAGVRVLRRLIEAYVGGDS